MSEKNESMSGTSVTITPVTSGQMPPPSTTTSNDSPVTITPVFTAVSMAGSTSITSGHTSNSTVFTPKVASGAGDNQSSSSNNIGGSIGSAGVTLSSSGIKNNGSTDGMGKDSVGGNGIMVLNKQRLQELVNEIDPREQLDEEVEDLLLNIADDFIDNVVTNACKLAKHRGAKTLEVKDVQLILEKDWNLFIPGFGSLPLANEFKQLYKKSPATEAHKQRLALIRKTLKKF